MNLLTMERLCFPADTSRALGHWGGVDPWTAADRVRALLAPQAVTLPLAWVCDGLVAPVVTWDQEVLSRRLERGQGPVLYRSVLADRLRTGRDELAPSPLRVEAFVTVAPLRRAMSTLARLAGAARAVAAVPLPPGPGPWETLEADFYGFTVVTVDADLTAQVVVRGLAAGKSAHLPVGHHRRLQQEQLFDLALRAGLIG